MKLSHILLGGIVLFSVGRAENVMLPEYGSCRSQCLTCPLPNTESELQACLNKAEDGDAEQQYVMYRCLLRKGDIRGAFMWLERAAVQGNGDAQAALGNTALVLSGHRLGFDERDGLFWITRAVQNGSADAMATMGMLMYNEADGETMRQEGLRKVKQAACSGSPRGVEMLYVAYMIEGQEERALRFAREASDKGYGVASRLLAEAYEAGRGVPKNRDEAFNLFRKAAVQGDAKSQGIVGFLYLNGAFGKRDIHEAIRMLTLSAEQGFIPAMRTLGMIYAKGDGVEANMNKALSYNRRAAELGDAESQGLMAALLMQTNPEAHADELCMWARRAAEGRDKSGCTLLGILLLNGQYNGKTNQEEGLKWMRKGAEMGEASAQYYLGLFYEKGQYVNQDLEQAREWYRQAARLEYPEAQQAVQRLEKTPL